MTTPTVPTPVVTVPVSAVADSRETTRTSRSRLSSGTRDAAWAAIAAAILVLIAGALTLATSQPWLFAALGPTAVIVASNPGHPTARLHSVVVGHAVALAVSWLIVVLIGAADAPGMSAAGAIGVSRVWASAMAVGVTALVQPSLRAYHPPAAATALLITLGAYHVTWKSSLSMMAGILVVALLGEWLQRIRVKDEPARR